MDYTPDNNNNQSWGTQRWYDKDPALHKALMQLQQASDKYQAQVALNIIKIVVEHQSSASDSEASSIDLREPKKTLNRRWYDVNETLQSAMQLLQDCPEDLQKTMIPTIVTMIEQSLEVDIS